MNSFIQALTYLRAAADEADVAEPPSLVLNFNNRRDRYALEAWLKHSLRPELLGSVAPLTDLQAMELYGIKVKITDESGPLQGLAPQVVQFLKVVQDSGMESGRSVMAPAWVFEKLRLGEKLTDSDLRFCVSMEWGKI